MRCIAGCRERAKNIWNNHVQSATPFVLSMRFVSASGIRARLGKTRRVLLLNGRNEGLIDTGTRGLTYEVAREDPIAVTGISIPCIGQLFFSPCRNDGVIELERIA